MIPRFLTQRLPDASTRRLVMITGARQTGKTTLAQATYPNLRYVSLDEVETRTGLRDLPTRAWTNTIGPAILDEAQKEPALFEKLKYAFDQDGLDFSVILGSSQILMLKNVRETLAGRVFIYELWPLMLREMTCAKESLTPPLLDRLISGQEDIDALLADEPAILLGSPAHTQKSWLDYALKWGLMPGLLEFSESDRMDWLRSYTNTYLERDLADLTRLDDLTPFRRFLRLAALRSGQILSYADLARDAGISPGTARNYLNYLTISYQAILLQPYFSNISTSLVKAPKLYWVDPGLWRYQTGFWGEEISGPLLETFVVSECHKWLKTMRPETELWYYRTHGGLEVDILITTASGMWGLEIKTNRQVKASQGAALRKLAAQMGSQWRGGMVIYMGEQIERLGENLWAIPVNRLLG